MMGVYLKDRSWEKQRLYELENGYIITVETGAYGCMISNIQNKKGIILYHSSDGMEAAPDWIKPWILPIADGHWQRVIRPCFDEVNRFPRIKNIMLR